MQCDHRVRVRAWIASLWVLGFLGTPEVQAAPVEIALEVASPVSAEVRLDLVTGNTSEGKDAIRLEIQAPAKHHLELPVRSAWRITADAAGWWTPSRILYVEESGSSVTLPLVPAGTVAGRLKVEDGEELPADIDLRLTPGPGEQARFETATVSCALQGDRWECAVPAGTLDLRLRRPGFLSHYFWKVAIGKNERVDLGVQELKRGASVVGWVQVEDPGPRFQFEKVNVELAVHGISQGRGQEDRRQRTDMGLATTPNARGFFQLTGVAPGSYRVTAVFPGMAPAELAPVQVLPGAETEIQELTLQPPVTLEVHVNPLRTPFRKPWRLYLARRGPVPGHLEPVAEGGSSAEGVWRASGLTPGIYDLSVQDDRNSRWWNEEVEVEAGMPPLDVQVSVMRLEGKLLLGDRPVSGAWLWFGGKHNARRIQVRSNEEGIFYVFLPRQDRWRVDIEAVPLNLQTRLEDVEIPERKSGEPWPRTVLRIPDTGIFGTVVDETGNPIETGTVNASTAQPGARRVSVPADADGAFLVRGLVPGVWKVDAVAVDPEGERRGIVPSVEVAEGERTGPVQIVLRRSRTLTGAVLSPEGRGVPGAQVEGILEQSLYSVPVSTYTDVNGVFELSVPHSVDHVQINVLPLGYAVTQVTAPLPSEPMTIPVEAVGGTVEIQYSGDGDPHPGQRWLRTVVLRDGVPVAHPLALQRWSEANAFPRPDGERFRIPMLPPGQYTVCLDTPSVYATGTVPANAVCAGGYLPPFGELVLALEVPAEIQQIELQDRGGG